LQLANGVELMKKLFKFFCVNLCFASVILSTPWPSLAFSNSMSSRSCSGILLQNYKKFKDSAIELEVLLNEQSVKLITTENGVLGDLFIDADELPQALKDFFRSDELKSDSWREKKLANLSTKLQVEAFKQGIIVQNLEFSSSSSQGRKIPNFYVKKEIQETYHILPNVDMGSPETPQKGSLLEFHMRDSIAPGELTLKALQFQKKMSLAPGSFHMHVVFNQDLKWLRQNPTINTWQLIEFWRRLNLTMEMRDVFENGRSLIENISVYGDRVFTNFAPLRYDEISSGFNYMRKLSHSKNLNTQNEAPLRSASKMGWIGMWGHDKYDAPDLFGFELRFLSSTDLPPNLVKYLNQLPQQVETHNFGMSADKIKIWGELMNLNTMDDSFSNSVKYFLGKTPDMPGTMNKKFYEALNPHYPYKRKFEELPFAFKKVLLGLNQKEVKRAFNSRGRLNYLVHDWRQDPLLFNQPELLEQIEKAQLHALRKWAQNSKKETQILQEFMLDSGLYKAFADSIGLVL
jgi:hypothetical protein